MTFRQQVFGVFSQHKEIGWAESAPPNGEVYIEPEYAMNEMNGAISTSSFVEFRTHNSRDI